jgi:hypothetical protein
MVSLRVDIRGVDAVQRELARIGDELKRGRATAMAVNKVADKARAEINRQIAERYTIKASEVRSSVNLRRASPTAGKLQAVISIFGSPSRKGRSMNMIRFLAAYQAAGRAHRTRGGKAGKKALAALGQQLGFQVLRGGGLKQIPGAFVGNSGRTVFRRVGKERLPIEPVQVIGVSQMFSSRAIRNRVMEKIASDLPVEMRRAVDMILARTA